jgi:hypothetical protein
MKGPQQPRDAQRVSISEKKRLKALVGPAIALSSINWILQTSDVNKVDVIDKPSLLLACSSLALFGTSAARWLSQADSSKSGSSSEQIFHNIRPDHWLIGRRHALWPLIDGRIRKSNLSTPNTAASTYWPNSGVRFQLCPAINFKLSSQKAIERLHILSDGANSISGRTCLSDKVPHRTTFNPPANKDEGGRIK